MTPVAPVIATTRQAAAGDASMGWLARGSRHERSCGGASLEPGEARGSSAAATSGAARAKAAALTPAWRRGVGSRADAARSGEYHTAPAASATSACGRARQGRATSGASVESVAPPQAPAGSAATQDLVSRDHADDALAGRAPELRHAERAPFSRQCCIVSPACTVAGLRSITSRTLTRVEREGHPSTFCVARTKWSMRSRLAPRR